MMHDIHKNHPVIHSWNIQKYGLSGHFQVDDITCSVYCLLQRCRLLECTGFPNKYFSSFLLKTRAIIEINKIHFRNYGFIY